jgi:hypothetical protein
MLAESTTDIILKTDPKGFIVHATSAISDLGRGEQVREPGREAGALVGPHLLDLVSPEAKQQISRAHARAMAGEDMGWIEFPALTRDNRKRWFEIRLRPTACWASCATSTNCARSASGCSPRPTPTRSPA